jgi:hypothetical protein
VQLTNSTVTIGSRSRPFATVGGARVAVLDLDTTSARIGRDGLNTTASNIAAALTPQAGAALDRAFGTTLFEAGLAVGTVAQTTKAAEAEVAEGATSLTLERRRV